MNKENYTFSMNANLILEIAQQFKRYENEKDFYEYVCGLITIPDEITDYYLRYKKTNRISNKLKKWCLSYMNSIHNTYINEHMKEPQKTISGYIYVYKQGKNYKIGRSLQEDCRVKRYITENPKPIELVLKYKVNDYIKEEKDLHKLFKSNIIAGRKEWFLLSDKDIKKIKQKYEDSNN